MIVDEMTKARRIVAVSATTLGLVKDGFVLPNHYAAVVVQDENGKVTYWKHPRVYHTSEIALENSRYLFQSVRNGMNECRVAGDPTRWDRDMLEERLSHYGYDKVLINVDPG